MPSRNLSTVAVLAVALALPASAHASGFTLNVAAPQPAVVGKPLLLQVTGTIPPEDLRFPYWFSLTSIPTTVLSSCPPDHWEAHQIAISTGGAILTMDQRESPDASGNFAVTVGANPYQAGQVLLCGYTDDGATQTLAASSLIVDVQPGAPVNLARPRVKRSHGRLVCRPGRWANEPTTFTYRWRAGHHKFRCAVTATNAAGAATAVSRPVRASRAPRRRSWSESAVS
jgi:hypothetical protein